MKWPLIPVVGADALSKSDINRVFLLVPNPTAAATGVPCQLWDGSDFHDIAIDPLPVPGTHLSGDDVLRRWGNLKDSS